MGASAQTTGPAAQDNRQQGGMGNGLRDAALLYRMVKDQANAPMAPMSPMTDAYHGDMAMSAIPNLGMTPSKMTAMDTFGTAPGMESGFPYAGVSPAGMGMGPAEMTALDTFGTAPGMEGLLGSAAGVAPAVEAAAPAAFAGDMALLAGAGETSLGLGSAAAGAGGLAGLGAMGPLALGGLGIFGLGKVFDWW